MPSVPLGRSACGWKGVEVRLVRRYVDVVLVFAVALVLVFAVAQAEQRRADTAMREYDSLTKVAAVQMDTWLANHLALQRSLAFLEPDADDLAVALEPGYVSFALFLDGDGRVIVTYPSRPDIGPGTDLAGRFSHIDAVLDGASQAFWASDAATTASGSVAATAVAGPGEPPTVLTFAFDMTETTLSRMLASLLDTVAGSRWSIADAGTGLALLGPVPTDGANARTFSSSGPSSGWRLEIVAPTSSINALVGGTTDWTARVAAVALVAALVLGCILRRRLVATSAQREVHGGLVVFEAASTPSLLLDPATATVIRANDAMASLVGVPNPRQLDGSDIGSVLVVDDPGGTQQPASEVIDLDLVLGGEPQQVEQRYWMQGEQRWGRVSARRLDRADTDPVVLLEIHDLDTQRQREAMLERQRVALQDMAGRVSHDLRTPITAMIGFAELLQRSPDAAPTDRAEWLERLAANARRLGEHVREMAQVAVDIADHPVTDVRACAARAIKLHDTAIHAAGADVTNLVPDDTSVAMPELLLRQVLANLIDNAVKYRDRARTVEVRIEAVRNNDGMIEVLVADNGPGIAPDQRERVFAAGVRGPVTEGLGSGLGLAMCRTLVEDFGGTLGVTDNEPVGARFSVWLPETSAAWPADVARDRPRSALPDAHEDAGSTLLDHLPISVLVLGDDRELTDANRVALAQHGWERDALPAETWIDHLPDDSVRSLVLDALFTGRTESWVSAAGAHAGLVVTLDGHPDGRGALVLSWPTSSATSLDLVHDELTGLPDRVVVRDRLVRALRDDAASVRCTAVLTVDLDEFRSFNERRGLSAGDQVLQAVADRLRASAVDEDSVARQGADEFVVVRPGLTGRDEALRVAERIRAHLAAPITLADGSVVSVACSVGVAVAGREHDPDLLLIAAAQALHEARRAEQPTAVVEVS